MTKVQEIMLRGNKEQIPLILSLVAAARKHGASAKEFAAACSTATDLLQGELFSKPLTEICDNVEAALKSV